MSRAIAVIGAGPSGFYAVDGLVRALPDVRIDIVDRLPCPYGLVRYGVAPDHQGTKAVQRQFERLLARPNVRFLGNVETGRDVSIVPLRENRLTALETGAVDAALLGVPENILAVDRGYNEILFVGDIVNFPQNAIGASVKKIQESPEEVYGIVRAADFFARDERNQRAVNGAGKNFRGVAAHDGLNHAVDRGAVVDIAAYEGGVNRLGRHEDGLQVDALLAVKALVKREMKRQKADVVGLDAEADFFRLGKQIVRRGEAGEN